MSDNDKINNDIQSIYQSAEFNESDLNVFCEKYKNHPNFAQL